MRKNYNIKKMDWKPNPYIKTNKIAKIQWKSGEIFITPGERLRSALEMSEVTQAELAKKIDVAPQKINDLITAELLKGKFGTSARN